jgi:hypothetical protein
MTGKPLRGQRPLWSSGWKIHLASALLGLFGGAAVAVAAWDHGGPWLALVPVAWLFMMGAARKIQVTLVHQCAHFNFTRDKERDREWGEVLGALILVDNFDSYYYEHVQIHHTKQLGSELDPDCRFLLQLGIQPGMTREALWRRLLFTTISPRFHGLFLRARLRANFIAASKPRRIVSSVLYATVLAVITANHWMVPFVVGWVIPVFGLYHIAALLNFSSLHFWLRPANPGTAKHRLIGFTAGRFLGEALPETTGPLELSRWVLRMLCLHLPTRIAVLSGDLPVHDYHHRYPRCLDWGNYVYTRQWDSEAGCPGWPAGYTENWGLVNSIDAVFEGLSRVPRFDAEPLPAREAEAVVRQM